MGDENKKYDDNFNMGNRFSFSEILGRLRAS